jgi:hypothetical protein
MKIFILLSLSFVCIAQDPPVKYKLNTPKNWNLWAITGSPGEALRIYGYAVRDSDGETFLKDYLANKIKNEEGFMYQSGDLASRTPGVADVADSDTCHVKLIEGTNKGREGWVHCSLLAISAEWKAYSAKQEAIKRAAAKKVADEKKKQQDEAAAQAEAKHRQIRAACSVIYQNTINKKVSDLTVREEQQINACQALGFYK